MNDIIKELQQKLEIFIKQLQENTRYSLIQVDIQFAENNKNDGLSISSNAGMWLNHSYMMEKEISDFIKKEYSALNDQKSISVNIKLSKIKKEQAMDCQSKNQKETKTKVD